ASACNRLEVIADALAAPIRSEACTTIRPPLGGTPGTVPGPSPGSAPPGGTTPPTAVNDQGLSLSISATATPRVQDRFVLFVRIENNTGQPRRNLRLRVLIPNGLQADLTQINSGMTMQ